MDNQENETTELTVRKNTEITVATPAERALQEAIQSVFGTLGGPSLDNFDGDKIARWKLQSLATGPGTKGIDDVPADGISVKYFYVHPVELDGPTDGEIVQAIRSVLITDDLTAYAFVSNMLARDLARMIAVFGNQVWQPAIKVKVAVNKGKGGHKFYTIVPV